MDRVLRLEPESTQPSLLTSAPRSQSTQRKGSAPTFAKSFLGKLQKQAKAIAESRDGVRARFPLAKQAIGKEGLEKRWKAGGNHSRTSRGISRSVAS